MGTRRGLERLITFIDAIVAIAITLLILPLVDDVSTMTVGGEVALWFEEEAFRILAFLISFAVIARLWLSHHSLFEHVRCYDARLMVLTLFWAFTIVLLPLPTAMTAAFDPQSGVVVFYIGTMAVSSSILTAIAFYVYRTPALQDDTNPVTADTLFGSSSATVGFIVALVLGSLIPELNYSALFVMLLLIPADLVYRIATRRRRRDAASGATSSAPVSRGRTRARRPR